MRNQFRKRNVGQKIHPKNVKHQPPQTRGFFYLTLTLHSPILGAPYEENNMTKEYRIALEHWAKQFRNGNLSDKFADEIAYLLEDKAHDLKMDHPEEEEEQVLQMWRVVVEQRNVFYEEAETEQEARRIASEDRTWGEVYNSATGDTYEFEITVEPDDD